VHHLDVGGLGHGKGFPSLAGVLYQT
jgi:hypothetical protein